MDLPSTPASIQSSRTASATSKFQYNQAFGMSPSPFCYHHIVYLCLLNSSVGNKEHRNILEGDLSLKYEPRSRTVRVYISSELSGE